MQWRRIVEQDTIDSGDEAERSGEDSELEGDGGLRCCQQTPVIVSAELSTSPGDDNTEDVDGEAGKEASGQGGEAVVTNAGGKAKLPWVTAMAPPSNMKVREGATPTPLLGTPDANIAMVGPRLRLHQIHAESRKYGFGELERGGGGRQG